ncbi:hypothetical protein H8D30_03865 [bacterium]|nr:hypothetical protein [bacterium]
MQKGSGIDGEFAVIATPIGNLGDGSLRVKENLENCEILLVESIRAARRLISAWEIKNRPKMVKWSMGKDGAEPQKVAKWVRDGRRVGLITDGGTPCVADPGYRLVRAVLEEGGRVVPIPGPSALGAAVSVSRWPVLPLAFWGFPPKGPGRVLNWLRRAQSFPGTSVFFVGPHRLARFMSALKEMEAIDVQAMGEMTKLYERRHDGSPDEVLARLPDKPKGEWTILVRFPQSRGGVK